MGYKTCKMKSIPSLLPLIGQLITLATYCTSQDGRYSSTYSDQNWPQQDQPRSDRCLPCSDPENNYDRSTNSLNPAYRGNGADNIGYDWSPKAWGGLAFPTKSKPENRWTASVGDRGGRRMPDWDQGGSDRRRCPTCEDRRAGTGERDDGQERGERVLSRPLGVIVRDDLTDQWGQNMRPRWDGFNNGMPITDPRRDGPNRIPDGYKPWDGTSKGSSGWDSSGKGYYFADKPDPYNKKGYASNWNYGDKDWERDKWPPAGAGYPGSQHPMSSPNRPHDNRDKYYTQYGPDRDPYSPNRWGDQNRPGYPSDNKYPSNRPYGNDNRPVYNEIKPVRPGYGDNRPIGPTYGSNRPGYDNRPDRPGYGDNRPDRPGYGDNRPVGSNYGDRPDRPGYGDNRPGYSDNRPGRPGYGDNRPDRPEYGDNRPDRPGYGDNRPGRPGYGDNRPDRPGYGDNRPDKPGYGDNKPDRPGYNDNKPGYGDSRPSYPGDKTTKKPWYDTTKYPYDSNRPNEVTSKPGYPSSKPSQGYLPYDKDQRPNPNYPTRAPPWGSPDQGYVRPTTPPPHSQGQYIGFITELSSGNRFKPNYPSTNDRYPSDKDKYRPDNPQDNYPGSNRYPDNRYPDRNKPGYPESGRPGGDRYPDQNRPGNDRYPDQNRPSGDRYPEYVRPGDRYPDRDRPGHDRYPDTNRPGNDKYPDRDRPGNDGGYPTDRPDNAWNYGDDSNRDGTYHRQGGSYPPYRGGQYYTSSYLASASTTSGSQTTPIEETTPSSADNS